MKSQLFSFLFLISLVFSVSAQNKEVQKIEEFGATNCCDYRARMDNLFIEIDKSYDAKGYVFVYEGNIEQRVYDKNGKYKETKDVPSEKGSAEELIDYFKNHLLLRRFSPEKIVFINAGFREKYTVELWLVPNGVNPPKPTPTLEKIKQRKPKHKPFGFCGEI
jgi:hypothetical protein